MYHNLFPHSRQTDREEEKARRKRRNAGGLNKRVKARPRYWGEGETAGPREGERRGYSKRLPGVTKIGLKIAHASRGRTWVRQTSRPR